ncbi:arginine decarboxylase, pyruvoyl-dependent, partial [Candidatus Micrarchaeota archaeon CG_4_10_14_0_2_um_filter_55_9]
VPLKVFITKGVGRHKDKLHSFELALRDAGIEKCNLVMVSSILPPGCEILSKAKGVELLKPGQITFCVMSRNESNEPNRLISASVGLAAPADKSTYGYLSEHHAFGQSDEDAGEYAEDMAASMLAGTLGIDFDINQSWDEREQQFKISGKIVKTTNATQSAVCDKTGLWTSVIAVAVFCKMDEGERIANNEQWETAHQNCTTKRGQ